MKQPNTLAMVGRIIFALPFLIFGLMHFGAADMLAPRVPFPPQVMWVYVTGAAMVAAAISIIIKRYTVYALFGLAAMVLVFNVTMHFPRAGADVAQLAQQFNMSEATAQEFKGMNMVIGMMNLIIIGACLMIAGYMKAEESSS